MRHHNKSGDSGYKLYPINKCAGADLFTVTYSPATIERFKFRVDNNWSMIQKAFRKLIDIKTSMDI